MRAALSPVLSRPCPKASRAVLGPAGWQSVLAAAARTGSGEASVAVLAEPQVGGALGPRVALWGGRPTPDCDMSGK